MPDRVAGRERELQVAGAFFDDLARGCAGLVFSGEPGIGKTTLWSAVVEEAHRRSFLVLSARAVAAEATLSFAALGDLLEPIADEVLPGLPDPQRRAAAVALLREDPADRVLDQRAIGAAVRTILQRMGYRRPVVVAVDDLQWLDRPSARALEFALRRLGDLPVALVASGRVGRGVRPSLDLERVLPAGRTTRVEVGPLSLAALNDVLKVRLGRSFPRRTLLRIAQAAGGNPLFALEIARGLPEDTQADLSVLPVPDTLIELVEARISVLPKPARGVLLAAAALHAPTVELVARAVGGTVSGSLAALERGARAGILRLDGSGPRFSHPLYAAAVYSKATPAERRSLHAQLARIVDGLEERARHLALAAEIADEGTAAVLDDAADRARRRGAPDSAAALAEHAVRLTPRDQRARVLSRTVKAAEYQFHAGELRRAREALTAVLGEVEGGQLRAEALCQLGEILFHESSFPEATRLFEEALVFADDELRSLIEIHLAYCSNAAGNFASAQQHAKRALQLAEPLGPEQGLAEALAVAAMANFLVGEGLDMDKIERALKLEAPDRQVTVEMRPTLIAGFLMLYEGRLERSVRLLAALRERIVERGEESDQPFVSIYLGWAECWRGNLQTAAAYCEEALECAARTGAEPMRCMSLAFAAVVAAYTGDAELTAARAEGCRELVGRVGYPIALLWACWALAILALSHGEAHAAEAALAPLLPVFEEHGVGEPIVGFFLPDAIEALILLGQLERSERLLAEVEASARRLGRGWALMAAGRCRAMLLSARGEADRAVQAAAEAVAIGEALELRLEYARTLLVAGQVERRRKAKRAARGYLERSLELFETAGARRWAEMAQAELGRIGLRPAARLELTESERRVAELAVLGLTNREVAARLFMSPKTVEANLARAYRKLDIRSRAELGARLGNAAGGTWHTRTEIPIQR